METAAPRRRVDATVFGLLPGTGEDFTVKLQTLLDANREDAELVLASGFT